MQGREQGFTLIELITVMVIVSILALMTTQIITQPVISYMNQQSRNTLVDDAESALQLMQRDIRRALPNSIRITGNSTVLELLHVSDGGRYRAKLTSTGTGNILDFTTADSSFDVIGSLTAAPSGSLVIYNLGDISANAYSGNNLAALSSASTTTSITLATATQFPLQSPQQRFFIVDTPITYSCSASTGTLLRYFGYAITATQANPPTGVSGEIQANNVSSCSFSYTPGSATRSGLVTLQITLTNSSNESSTLIHQIHVDNAP
jgi:MSHA biogenesis protein MshO